jgi:NADPH:quinone reductase-like Zn-dependent oxidoreductase
VPAVLTQRLCVCTPQDNDWSLTSYPLIPGHEVVGTISAVGVGVQGLDPGDRHVHSWLRLLGPESVEWGAARACV